MKILIIFYSRGGTTRKMAEEIERGAKDAGAEIKLKETKSVGNEDLLWADGIIIGSPVYFGLPAAEIKKIFDDSFAIRGKLENKIGAAFTSSYHPSGGKETTIISILQSMLVHGMIVCGDPLSSGGHYGAACHEFDEKARKECYGLGKRVAELAGKFKKNGDARLV
ncbi:flavodoxin [Candidatus Falkowbacteria bacterium RBG_13_39_14]|uniref:Flavodoxin n=1 Tax=Candidatus Falkowbacteria bacterium RBG_13_39_14 TaxID=1797985 RepID=A0A1F5S8J2_9BACT|nr:MAG: flavodoxin [Candidatus Falkowbacteria bacterium RBG_13_39_14]